MLSEFMDAASASVTLIFGKLLVGESLPPPLVFIFLIMNFLTEGLVLSDVSKRGGKILLILF